MLVKVEEYNTSNKKVCVLVSCTVLEYFFSKISCLDLLIGEKGYVFVVEKQEVFQGFLFFRGFGHFGKSLQERSTKLLRIWT